MKAYHGSKSKFNQFSIKGSGKHGEGFYFTLDYAEARYFAKSLYGEGNQLNPTVYTVTLNIKNSFNTMNIDHCNQVMSTILGQSYKVNKNASGAKEHYHYLGLQLKRNGISVNEAIRQSGFDSLFWEFGNHIVVFNSDDIIIENQESIEI